MPLRLPLRKLTLCLLILSTTAAAQLPPTGKQESEEEKEKALALPEKFGAGGGMFRKGELGGGTFISD